MDLVLASVAAVGMVVYDLARVLDGFLETLPLDGLASSAWALASA